MKTLTSWCTKTQKSLLITEGETTAEYIDPIKMIEAANQEVAAARNLFARAEDPDMIEWAIFNLMAAEKRYNYLLKKYRQDQAGQYVNSRSVSTETGGVSV